MIPTETDALASFKLFQFVDDVVGLLAVRVRLQFRFSVVLEERKLQDLVHGLAADFHHLQVLVEVLVRIGDDFFVAPEVL